jgi:uncharacterized protein
MKLLLSPAKLMDTLHVREIKVKSKPKFITDSSLLVNELKEKNLTELQKHLGISSNLTQTNWDRFQEWSKNPTNENGIQAILGYKGEVYRSLDAETLSDDAIEYLQKQAFIFSGLYGILKPLDFIMPYRLEMATPHEIVGTKNLYAFWQEKLTNYLRESTEYNEVILNLTSDEYMKSINQKKLDRTVVNCQFKTFKNGKLSSVMMHLKGGRGLMARYCAENKIKSIDEVKKFTLGNFYYSEENSTNTNLVFIKEI